MRCTFKHFMFIAALCLFLGLPFGLSTAATAQVITERITVHSPSIAGNLESNSPDRKVIVYLPADYHSHPDKRYPVLYALHGYSINNEIWTKEINTPQSIDNAYAAGVKGMIIVLPDSQTVHNGSMYSNSVTTGNWEGFITKDLITYIDANYRTLATRESRGLAGHSMGGYGTLRIGMKYPEYFAAIYSLSPCCLSARQAPSEDVLNRLKAVTTPEQSPSLSFWERATMASAAAWSPNPLKAPLYFDLPTGDAQADHALLARWAANAPLAMFDQYVPNLKSFTAIAIDMGDKDGLKSDSDAYHQALTTYGITHTYDIYDGDHVNRLPDRIQNHVLPFFGKHLKFAD